MINTTFNKLLFVILLSSSSIMPFSIYIENSSKYSTEYIDKKSNVENESEGFNLLSNNFIITNFYEELLEYSFMEKIYTFQSNKTLFKPPMYLLNNININSTFSL